MVWSGVDLQDERCCGGGMRPIMKETYERISPTAKFVAYLRTFTDIPFAKEIADESGAERTY
jgi:hypothetical protein